MEGRRLVSERGLIGLAVRHLTADALGELAFEALGPVKALLKRFFSAEPWSAADAEALADLVGPGRGWWRHRLDDDLALEFGWVDGRFSLDVTSLPDQAGPPSPDPRAAPAPVDATVAHEATPNPRTVMFRTGPVHHGPVHHGPSRPYRAGEEVDDPRVARLLRASPHITDVLVAADFVAVTLDRPHHWEALLGPVLEVVAEEFGAGRPGGAGEAPPLAPGPARTGPSRPRKESRLERAWRELGTLRPGQDDDLERVRAAARHEDAARRQVAANLLREADGDVARQEWGRLVGDRSRQVRRAAVDAMVDVGREELRPLLEEALGDEDAWVRWKALRGLADLGAERSRRAIEAMVGDADFRVREEARAALRGGPERRDRPAPVSD